MIIPVGMMRVMVGLAGIDRHAADRILDRWDAVGVVGTAGSGLGHFHILFGWDHIPYRGIYMPRGRESMSLFAWAATRR